MYQRIYIVIKQFVFYRNNIKKVLKSLQCCLLRPGITLMLHLTAFQPWGSKGITTDHLIASHTAALSPQKHLKQFIMVKKLHSSALRSLVIVASYANFMLTVTGKVYDDSMQNWRCEPYL